MEYDPIFSTPLVKKWSYYSLSTTNNLVTFVFFAGRKLLPLAGKTLQFSINGKNHTITINNFYEMEVFTALPASIKIIFPGDIEYTCELYQSGRLHINLTPEEGEKIVQALSQKVVSCK